MSTQIEPLTGLRVLLVEDEVLIAEELRERLERHGLCPIGIADTGERAIALALAHEPELVLMDIRLKGAVDGIEAARKLREHMDVPVVFLTAHSDRDTLRRAKQAGPYGYVLKPFDERELMVAMEIAMHRHELEVQLRESEQRYVATLSSIGDGVVATDPEGRVRFMNPVAEALTRWSLADASGRPIDDVLPLAAESSLDPLENPTRVAMREGRVVHADEPVSLRTRAHEWIPVDQSAAPICDERGSCLGAVVAFRDIRQRRLAEDALRRAENQLRQSQKMEAIGRLAGGVAHDFNNLLTVVSGSAELLLDEFDLDEGARALALEIKSVSERAAGLTNQMLAFSRKQVVQPVRLHIGELISEISRMLERLIGEDVALETRCDPDLWTIRADPSQVEQMVLNLVVNARDAMPRGGKLVIEAQNRELTSADEGLPAEERPGRYVVLRVRDTGTGMDADTKDHLFEPFFTTKAPGEGSGLGLATVYGVVKQMDGFIRLESEPDAGTVFELHLPVSVQAPSEERPRTTPVLETPLGTGRILVAEDDDAIRALIGTALRRQGYEVEEAADGDQALERLDDHAGDVRLLVTDVVMRGMSGAELADRVRAIRPEIRVLFVSGYTDDAVLRHGVEVGEHTYLEKPFSLSELARKVHEVLGGDDS